DLLQKWNVLRFRGLFESLDVGEKIRAVLIGDHLRAIERHLVRPRVADVVDESVRVERRGRQPRPVPRLPGVTMTFPAAILRVVGLSALCIAGRQIQVRSRRLAQGGAGQEREHKHDVDASHWSSYGLYGRDAAFTIAFSVGVSLSSGALLL